MSFLRRMFYKFGSDITPAEDAKFVEKVLRDALRTGMIFIGKDDCFVYKGSRTIVVKNKVKVNYEYTQKNI